MEPKCHQEMMPEVENMPREIPEGGIIARDENGHFLPGQSGNPSGHPRRTWEQQAALEEIRKLAPDAAAKMQEMLGSETVPARDKIRLIEIILDRTYGKPEAAVRLTTVHRSVEAAETRIAALAAMIRIAGDADGD